MRTLAVGLVLLATAGLSVLPGFAQQEQSAPATKFERFLLSKGMVRLREFYPIGRLGGGRGSAAFVVGRAYSPGMTDYIVALRVDVEDNARVPRKLSGILDSEEIVALAAALPQMRKMMVSLSQNPGQAEGTEVDFQGGSVRIGFLVDAHRQASIYVQAGDIGAVTGFFESRYFVELEGFIQKSLEKIQELDSDDPFCCRSDHGPGGLCGALAQASRSAHTAHS